MNGTTNIYDERLRTETLYHLTLGKNELQRGMCNVFKFFDKNNEIIK